MMSERPSSLSFLKHEVEDYEKKRYRGLDQRFVDQREKRILRRILGGIQEDGSIILDIPSGYGRFSDLLLERGSALVSSDLSFHMLRRAKERSSLEGVHSVVVSDAKKGLPFKGEAFTILICMRFFHHLHKKEEREFVLKEFATVSSNWVILTFYKKNFLHILQRKLRRRIKKTKRRISMISMRKFQQEVNRAGLSVAEVFPLFRIFHAQHIVLLRKS
jgi:SAM-dependent methyltransferase